MRRTLILSLALLGGLGIDWLAVRLEADSPPKPAKTESAGPVSGNAIPVTAAPAKPEPGKADSAKPPSRTPPAATLEQLFSGQIPLVDLTWPLNAQGAYWPGDQYKPFELRTIATLEKDGVLSKAFCMPEHEGTHLDAPNHFAAGQVSVDRLPPTDFFAPAVLIDISARCASDADALLTAAEIQAWEKQQGPIPRRAIVLLSTGWGRHFMQPVRYRNQDVQGRMHFPGFSAEAVDFLLAERDIRGIGIDTLSIDRGLSRDFAVHKRLNAAGRYGLENLAGLDKLPSRDFYLVVAPIKIESGSGGPTRVFAVVPRP